MSSETDDLVLVARVVKTRGLRGELVADLLTDFPDRFDDLKTLTGIGPEGRRSLEIEEHWFHQKRIVLKFVGFDSIDEAKQLVGLDLGVPASDRVELPEDHFYDWELAGCQVETVSGAKVGIVIRVMRPGGVELLVVETQPGKDVLIPMVDDICVEIDVDHKLIRIDPPEGLLEL